MPFVQFPVGTIRGPYHCGPYYGGHPSYQFLVRQQDSWAYFIDKKESVARQKAEEHSKVVLEKAKLASS